MNIGLTLNIGCDAPSYRLGQLQFLPDKPAPSLYGRGPALQVMLVANLAKVIVAAYSSHLSSQKYRSLSISMIVYALGGLYNIQAKVFSYPINPSFPNP